MSFLVPAATPVLFSSAGTIPGANVNLGIGATTPLLYNNTTIENNSLKAFDDAPVDQSFLTIRKSGLYLVSAAVTTTTAVTTGSIRFQVGSATGFPNPTPNNRFAVNSTLGSVLTLTGLMFIQLTIPTEPAFFRFEITNNSTVIITQKTIFIRIHQLALV